ncbi:MAG: hypothetical protein KGJ78_04020 [Alphaproteobacteria bacterium]|nr:hypothetical protein [Alphaproteobacteria bacterium]
MHSPYAALKVISARTAATAVLLLGGAIVYLINFPGSMEDDSFAQLVEGRTGSYSFWHPPIMSWMLGVSDALPGPPEAYFVAFDMLLAFGALASLVWLRRRVSWGAVACGVIVLLLPQLMLLQAVVWKDGLFADLCLAAFVCLAHADSHWLNVRIRYGLVIASIGFIALAMLARQNGFVMLPFAAGALGWSATRIFGWRKGLLHAAAFAALSAGLALGINALLALRSDGLPAQEEQFKVLHLYDLTGMVRRDPSLPLPVLDRQSPGLAHLIRTEGVRLWSPVKNDTLELSGKIVAALEDTPADVLTRQWQEAVLRHPGLYLAVRGQLFAWVFWPVHVELCHPYHIGDEGNPDDLAMLGAQPRMDARDVALGDYAHAFVGTPVFWHPFYALIVLGVMVVLLRRRARGDIAIAALLASALVFTASFFVISIACDYRYLYVIDLSALAGLLYLSADPGTKRGPEGPL